MTNPPPVTATFLHLVSISSPTGSEQPVAAWISSYLSRLGYTSKIDSYGNLISRLPGTGRPLLFTAHMDTVQPGENIRPVRKNGLITSSGDTILGADNKAAIAAILTAVGTLARSSSAHPPLELVFTTSEESGNTGAANLDYSGLASTVGYSFDYGAPLGTIFTASPYYHRIDITLTGRSSHAANPGEAKNVLPAFASALSALHFGQVNPDTLVNIGLVQSGTARNTIPGSLSVSGEVRSFSKSQLQRHTNTLIRAFRTAGRKNSLRVSADVVLENPGFRLAPNHPAILSAVSVLTSLGLTPRLTSTHACFDANIFHSRGITVINLSDGSRANHTPQESIRDTDLSTLARIVLGLMYSQP